MSKKRKNRSKYEREHSIFLYFKEHPSTFIAFATAFVTVISFAMNMFVYFHRGRYLSYWGFESSIVSINTSREIYVLVVCMATFFVSSIMQEFMLDSVSVFLKDNKSIFFINYLIKKLSKNVRKSEMLIRKHQKETERLAAKHIALVNNCCAKYKTREEYIANSLTEEKEHLKHIRESLDGTKVITNDLKRIRKNLWGIMLKKIIPSVVLNYVVLFVVFLVVFNITIGDKGYVFSLGFAGIVSLLITICPFILVFKTLPERKKYKEAIDNVETIEKYLNDLKKEVVEEYPIEKFINWKHNFVISNARISSIAMRFLIFIIAFLISFSFSSHLLTKEKKEFSVLELESKTYVLIYDNEYLYLNELEIDDNTAKIYNNKHRMIKVDDFSFETMEFDGVVIVE